jgi:hypothetical protein
MHLGGEEIPYAGLSILADRAKEEALLLYSSSTAPESLPTKAALKNPSAVTEEKIFPNT